MLFQPSIISSLGTFRARYSFYAFSISSVNLFQLLTAASFGQEVTSTSHRGKARLLTLHVHTLNFICCFAAGSLSLVKSSCIPQLALLPSTNQGHLQSFFATDRTTVVYEYGEQYRSLDGSELLW